MSLDPEQAETIYKLLGAMRAPLERTHGIVERGFRDVVGALGALLATLPRCVTCGAPATFRAGEETTCAGHAAVGSARMPAADAVERAIKVLRLWRPRKPRKDAPSGVAKSVKAEGLAGARCQECGMVLTLRGLGEIVSVECGREHEVTLADGRCVLLDANGIPTVLPPALEAMHETETLNPSAVPTVPSMRRVPR